MESTNEPLKFNTVEDFMKAYEKHVAKGDEFICYFYGALDDKGVSWCPYCTQFGPLIEQEVLKKTKYPVLIGYVPREEWLSSISEANKNHPFKKHPILAVPGVPTL